MVLLVVTMLLVLANAFFVASEFAIVKVRPTRLEQLVREGSGVAKRALHMSRHLDSYLSANQLGITLASLALGWIGEPATAHLLLPLLSGLGGMAEPTAHATALTISFVVITALHTIVGELAPKSLAIQRTEQVTLLTAIPLHLFFLLMWPFIWCLNGAANALIGLFGLKPTHEDEVRHTSEELRMLLTGPAAALDPELRRMLARVFDFRRRTARHVMSLRTDTATLRANMSVDDAIAVAGDAGYTRYPVTDESGREVLGYVHVRDLFDVLRGARRAKMIAELLREPLQVKETASIEGLRRAMQATQVPMAVVVNKAGDFVGIISMEDLLEEIVGEIRDENDEEIAPIQQRSKGLIEVDGRVLVADLERELGITLPPRDGVETIGAFLLVHLGRTPQPGDAIDCDDFTLIVADVVGTRIRRVRIVLRTVNRE
jgi:CBS domain containing-hemolysin-like protein